MTGLYWLASYPRSGNTWLRLALRSLQRRGAPVDFTEPDELFPIASLRHSFDRIMEVESSDLTLAEAEVLRPRFYEELARAGDAPLVRKVHDAWTLTAAGEPLFPPAATLGAVYIVRDPRDVAVSFAHFSGSTLDQAIARMNDPCATMGGGKTGGLSLQLRQRLLTWSGHVESWLDAPELRWLLVRYEDMLLRPEIMLAQAAAFLGLSAEASTVAAAVDATRFAALNAEEAHHGFREKPSGPGMFFRRGIAGGWRDTLTSGQACRIERDHGRVMARIGYSPAGV